jgi:hypothetical protein
MMTLAIFLAEYLVRVNPPVDLFRRISFVPYYLTFRNQYVMFAINQLNN